MTVSFTTAWTSTSAAAYYRLILLLLISALAIAVLSLLGAAGERFRRAAGGEAGLMEPALSDGQGALVVLPSAPRIAPSQLRLVE